MKKKIVTLAAMALAANLAQAAATVSFEEVGADVVATLSGSLDLTGMFNLATLPLPYTGVNPGGAAIASGVAGDGLDSYFNQLSGPTQFGTYLKTPGSFSSGDAFVLDGELGNLFLPAGYTSGTALNSQLTLAGTSFAGLGLTPGSHLFTLTSSDTITVTVLSPVPEPASVIMMGLGLMAVIGVRRIRM